MRRIARAARSGTRWRSLVASLPRLGSCLALAVADKILVCSAAGERLGAYALPPDAPAWRGRAVSVHTLAWCADGEEEAEEGGVQGAPPRGCLLAALSVAPPPDADADDAGDASESDEAPLLALRWSGAPGGERAPCEPECAQLFQDACLAVDPQAAPPGGGPYLRLASLPAWGLALAAHRKASDEQLCCLSLAGGSPGSRTAQQLDFMDEAEKLRLPLRLDEGDNYVTGLAMCCSQHTAAGPPNRRTPDQGALQAGPLALVSTSDGKLRLFVAASYEPERYSASLLVAPQPLPPPPLPQEAEQPVAQPPPAHARAAPTAPAVAAAPAPLPPAVLFAPPPPPAAAAIALQAAAAPPIVSMGSFLLASPPPPEVPPTLTPAPTPQLPTLHFRADLSTPPAPVAPARSAQAAVEARGGLFVVCADVADAVAEVSALAQDVSALLQRVRAADAAAPFAHASVSQLMEETAEVQRSVSAASDEVASQRAAFARLREAHLEDERLAAELRSRWVLCGEEGEASGGSDDERMGGDEDDSEGEGERAYGALEPALAALRYGLRSQLSGLAVRLGELETEVEARERGARAQGTAQGAQALLEAYLRSALELQAGARESGHRLEELQERLAQADRVGSPALRSAGSAQEQLARLALRDEPGGGSPTADALSFADLALSPSRTPGQADAAVSSQQLVSALLASTGGTPRRVTPLPPKRDSPPAEQAQPPTPPPRMAPLSPPPALRVAPPPPPIAHPAPPPAAAQAPLFAAPASGALFAAPQAAAVFAPPAPPAWSAPVAAASPAAPAPPAFSCVAPAAAAAALVDAPALATPGVSALPAAAAAAPTSPPSPPPAPPAEAPHLKLRRSHTFEDVREEEPPHRKAFAASPPQPQQQQQQPPIAAPPSSPFGSAAAPSSQSPFGALGPRGGAALATPAAAAAGGPAWTLPAPAAAATALAQLAALPAAPSAGGGGTTRLAAFSFPSAAPAAVFPAASSPFAALSAPTPAPAPMPAVLPAPAPAPAPVQEAAVVPAAPAAEQLPAAPSPPSPPAPPLREEARPDAAASAADAQSGDASGTAQPQAAPEAAAPPAPPPPAPQPSASSAFGAAFAAALSEHPSPSAQSPPQNPFPGLSLAPASPPTSAPADASRPPGPQSIAAAELCLQHDAPAPSAWMASCGRPGTRGYADDADEGPGAVGRVASHPEGRVHRSADTRADQGDANLLVVLLDL